MLHYKRMDYTVVFVLKEAHFTDPGAGIYIVEYFS